MPGIVILLVADVFDGVSGEQDFPSEDAETK
jgi:hypothetical protein